MLPSSPLLATQITFSCNKMFTQWLLFTSLARSSRTPRVWAAEKGMNRELNEEEIKLKTASERESNAFSIRFYSTHQHLMKLTRYLINNARLRGQLDTINCCCCCCRLSTKKRERDGDGGESVSLNAIDCYLTREFCLTKSTQISWWYIFAIILCQYFHLKLLWNVWKSSLLLCRDFGCQIFFG